MQIVYRLNSIVLMSCVISRQQQAADQQCVECGGARGVAGGMVASQLVASVRAKPSCLCPARAFASVSLFLVLTHIFYQLFFLTHTSATEGFYFLVFHLYRTFRYIRFVGVFIE